MHVYDAHNVRRKPYMATHLHAGCMKVHIRYLWDASPTGSDCWRSDWLYTCMYFLFYKQTFQLVLRVFIDEDHGDELIQKRLLIKQEVYSPLLHQQSEPVGLALHRYVYDAVILACYGIVNWKHEVILKFRKHAMNMTLIKTNLSNLSNVVIIKGNIKSSTFSYTASDKRRKTVKPS